MKKITDNIFLFKYFLEFEDFKGYTNIFVVVGNKFIFVLDTSSNPIEMQTVKEFILQKYTSHKIVVFNSHSDFDHFGGNNAFEKEIIIATNQCKINIANQQVKKIALPNVSFEKRLSFPNEQVIFFASQGHTKDSASCYFKKHKFLFCGDNVENPHPYYKNELLKEHIKTLESYKKYDFNIIAFGHGNVEYGSKLLNKNINYLKGKMNETG